MEDAARSFETQLFSNINETVTSNNKPSGFDAVSANHNVSTLFGSSSTDKRIGPAVLLKVMAGDKFKASVMGWYQPGATVTAPASGLSTILSAVISAMSSSIVSGTKVTAGDLSSGNALNAPATALLSTQGTPGTGVPKAYLNWIVLDEEKFQAVSGNYGASIIPTITGTMTTGMAGTSTHTDKEGKVVAVYDDGDLGIYKHKGTNLETRIELSSHNKTNTSAGGTKMGETPYWDEFLATHPNERGDFFPTSSNGTTYKIDFSNSWDGVVDQKTMEAKNMPFWEVAEQSKNGGKLSLQDQPELNAQGRLFKGKYYSTESMGNYLAGYNANQAGMPTFDGFQRIAGALELQTHGQPGIHLGKLEMIKLALGITSYGTHPLHGEVIQQYRMSKAGWDAYERPQGVIK